MEMLTSAANGMDDFQSESALIYRVAQKNSKTAGVLLVTSPNAGRRSELFRKFETTTSHHTLNMSLHYPVKYLVPFLDYGGRLFGATL